IVFLNSCDASVKLSIMETIHLRSVLPNKQQMRKARQEYGYAYTHDNVSQKARRTDFQCIDVGALMRQLERGL
ncbi:hypothetical protein LCGC14_1989580, partial [marine sediment metagenome]